MEHLAELSIKLWSDYSTANYQCQAKIPTKISGDKIYYDVWLLMDVASTYC